MSVFINPGIDNLSSLNGRFEIDLLEFSVEMFFQGLFILIKKVEAPINKGSVSLNHGLFQILLKNGLQSITEHLEKVHVIAMLREMEDGPEFFTGLSVTTSEDKGKGRVYAEW